jgi:thiamine pyrophosphokinase
MDDRAFNSGELDNYKNLYGQWIYEIEVDENSNLGWSFCLVVNDWYFHYYIHKLDGNPVVEDVRNYVSSLETQDEQEITNLRLDYLIERGIPSVNVVWATGRRADHTITNLTNIVSYRNLLKIVIHDDHSKIFLLPQKFQKWYPKKTNISLIPIGIVTGITTKNLLYPLEKESLTMGYRTGSSNAVVEDGLVTILHDEGDLLLMECVD